MRDHIGLFERDIQAMYSRADGTPSAPPLDRQLMRDLQLQPD
jgi:hypothetical protein